MLVCDDCLKKDYRGVEPSPKWTQVSMTCVACGKNKPCSDMPEWFLLKHKKSEVDNG